MHSSSEINEMRATKIRATKLCDNFLSFCKFSQEDSLASHLNRSYNIILFLPTNVERMKTAINFYGTVITDYPSPQGMKYFEFEEVVRKLLTRNKALCNKINITNKSERLGREISNVNVTLVAVKWVVKKTWWDFDLLCK